MKKMLYQTNIMSMFSKVLLFILDMLIAGITTHISTSEVRMVSGFSLMILWSDILISENWLNRRSEENAVPMRSNKR